MVKKLKLKLKVGERVMFHGRSHWFVKGSINAAAKEGEVAIVESVEASTIHLRHPCRPAGFDVSEGRLDFLLHCADVVSVTCARIGCSEQVAYPGAEYCGAACSEQRKVPKTSDDVEHVEHVERLDVASAYPHRLVVEGGPGIEHLPAKPTTPKLTTDVDDWDLLPDVDVRR